jgi:hypothetical protein
MSSSLSILRGGVLKDLCLLADTLPLDSLPHPSFSIAYIHHILFVHSFAKEHLVSFYLLAIVNNVAMYIKNAFNPLHSMIHGNSVFPEPFVEKIVLFPVEWCWYPCENIN